MTDINVLFCQLMLSQARDEARRLQVKLPKHITALRADRRQFFVEADGIKGEYFTAYNAFEARAKFIWASIERQRGGMGVRDAQR